MQIQFKQIDNGKNIFTNGGNSFGVTGILGTNDAFDMTIISGASISITSTNNISILTSDGPDGSILLQTGEGTPSGGITLKVGAAAGDVCSNIDIIGGGGGQTGSSINLTAGNGTTSLAGNITILGGNDTGDPGGLAGDVIIAGGDNLGTVGSTEGNVILAYTGATVRGLVGIGTSSPDTLLHVAGDTHIDGKLTVDGAIDPPSVTLSGGTALFYESNDGSTAPVSGAATGRLRYDNTGTGNWQISKQSGTYSNIITSLTGYIDGGNSFGGNATLGLNDEFNFTIYTVNRTTVGVSGGFIFIEGAIGGPADGATVAGKGCDIFVAAGAGGIAAAATLNAGNGGEVSIGGGIGGDGSATGVAGSGGTVEIGGGDAGVNGGAGGNDGGTVHLIGGTASGAGINGVIRFSANGLEQARATQDGLFVRTLAPTGSEVFGVAGDAHITGFTLIDNYISLAEIGADPANVINHGFLYTKDVAGITELFFERDDGTVVQIT